MEISEFGGTSLKVSSLSLGTAALGMNYGIPTGGRNLSPSRREAARIKES